MIGLKIKRRWQRNCICCQRFFLFRSFFLYPVSFFFLTCFIPLFIPESKTFIPFARYFYTAFVGRGIIMELLSFSLSLHRFFSAERAVFFDMLIQKIHAVGCVLLPVWFLMSVMASWQVPRCTLNCSSSLPFHLGRGGILSLV